MTARTVAVLMGGLAGATPAAARACPGPAVAGQLPGAEPVPVCVEEVRFSADGLSLAGQWFTPREPGSAGPLPAAVLIRGSGPSHRGSVWTETLAGVLVAEGVGVLVPDKRGSGASEGDWRAASFSALADDALAGVRYLTGRPDVDAARVGLMGLSQGGMVAPVAASRTDSVAFVVNVVGSAVPLLESVRFEMLHTFREEGLEGERLETAMALVDTAVGHIRGRISWDDYEAALHGARPVLGDEIADAYFIPTPDHWRWAFFRRLEGFDA
ncbi:MAG: CocE/NonD family hydrolase, partial [Longimicrobiales bacterium]|nr:CocE/NonD family hydrolase [Longimicrobiales bacterium]